MSTTADARSASRRVSALGRGTPFQLLAARSFNDMQYLPASRSWASRWRPSATRASSEKRASTCLWSRARCLAALLSAGDGAAGASGRRRIWVGAGRAACSAR